MVEEKDMSDHDLLICMNVKLSAVKRGFENHLKHHAVYTYLAITSMLGVIITLATFIIKGG